MAWMEEENILDVWFRPELGLYEDDPDLTRYYGRVVGNSPELMPLDKRLNKDTHEAANQHYILTNDMNKDNPKRFGLETPNQVSSTYERIWDPITGVAPTPNRIAQDIERVFTDAIPRIIQGRGMCLDDNCQKGKRFAKRGTHNSKWGGDHRRKLALNNYGAYNIYPDACEGVEIKLEKAKKDFNGVKLEKLELTMADALGLKLDGEDDDKALVSAGKEESVKPIGYPF